jgi:sugar lactone lactonase YvrE
MRIRIWIAAAALALLVAPGAAHARDPLDVELFARVPDPGSPEGIAIDSAGAVYVGTSPKEGGPLGRRRPSKIFAFDSHGNLEREYPVSGQDLDELLYGLVGMAFDGHDLLYALDAKPPRVIRLDPRTGEQVDYASFRDVPPCHSAQPGEQCSETDFDMAPYPDYPVFARDGTMYVTDLTQALIWRVPPGGGEAEVWFTDPGLETLFGPNGIQFMADGRTLLFVLSTQSNPASPTQRLPGLYTLPVRDDGSPGELRQFWASGFADVADGFAIALSGNVYVALAGTTGNSVAVISPAGQEIARTPASELENQQMEVPFDQPASAAFLSKRVLVTNHALFSRNPDHYAVLDVFAGEPGLPLFRPIIDAGNPPQIKASARPRRATEGERTCFRFRARLGRGFPLVDAEVRFAGDDKATNERGRARMCARLHGGRGRVARVRKPGFEPDRVRIRVVDAG